MNRRSIPYDVAPVRRRSEWRLWKRCWDGLEPAESLTTRDREDLVWDMVHQLGWTDREIAEHTRMTPYTVSRIRARLGLPANQPTARAA
jgi:hypothetical protein